NSIAERFVLTARRELLDHVLIFSARHLEAVIKEFLAHYHQAPPAPRSRTALPGPCDAGSNPIARGEQNCPPRPPRRVTPRVLLGRLIELTEAWLRHRTGRRQVGGGIGSRPEAAIAVVHRGDAAHVTAQVCSHLTVGRCCAAMACRRRLGAA